VRAVTIAAYGGREQLAVTEVADPKPAPGEVVVQVAAAALNRMDTFIRQGLTGPGVRRPRELPHVLGAEGAGTVVDISAAETDLAVGDRVVIYPGLHCGSCRYCRRGQQSRCAHYGIRGEDAWGTQCELVAVAATDVLRIPDDVTFEEAAAAPVGYTTSWTMMVTAGRLRPAERVLVVGASGGVAIAAMQIADHSGAEVLAMTRDPEKARRLAELPFVHHVIGGAEPGWSERVLAATASEGVDMVVDSVGAPTWRDSIRSLAQGGRMVVCGATGGDTPDISIRELYQSHRQIIGGPFGGWDDFRLAMEFMFRSGVRPLVHAVLPLEEVAEAHRIIEDGEHIGKVVLRSS
jgi:NADPH:quinone reductase-like Zn-dependent oxidoreductase